MSDGVQLNGLCLACRGTGRAHVGAGYTEKCRICNGTGLRNWPDRLKAEAKRLEEELDKLTPSHKDSTNDSTPPSD